MYTLRLRLISSLLLLLLCYSTTAISQTNELVGIKVLPLPNHRVRLMLQFQSPLKKKPTSFVMKKPAKLVFDFLSMKEGLPSSDLSKEIKVGVLNQYTLVPAIGRLRIVLDLSEVVPYYTDIVGRQFNITLSGKYVPPDYKKKVAFYTNKYVKTRHRITDVDFRGGPKRGGKLIIKLSDSNMNADVTQRGDKIHVKFLNTGVPSRLIRRLDVTDFRSPAQTVDTAQRGTNARFTINNRGDFGYFSYQVNKEFVVEVFPLTPEEIKEAKLKKEVFTGRRISLNFQNISVRAVLQLIADFTGQNLVVSDAVRGNITLRLNKIPWDQALSIILKTRGLVKRQMGDVILVAPSTEVAAREKAELAQIQQSKELEPLLSDLMQINYAKAGDIAALINDKSNTMLSPRGRLSVDARTNSIWIQDTGTKLRQIKDLIVKLDIPVRQVLIEARIVNVTKDVELDLGIRFGVTHPDYLSGTLEGANVSRQGTSAPNIPLNQRLNLDLLAPVTTGTPASIGIALAQLSNGTMLDLELSALETEGKAKLISSPRLITANQQEAVIEQGEEVPYQEAASSGATTVAFKKAVLSLKVTPQITPDDKIILDLAINQDNVSSQQFLGVPAIETKQIDTNVLVSNGQTIVLGGIYKKDTTQAIKRIPFLGEMPVIGVLFRNKQNIERYDELLIFITPKIIRPTFKTS